PAPRVMVFLSSVLLQVTARVGGAPESPGAAACPDTSGLGKGEGERGRGLARSPSRPPSPFPLRFFPSTALPPRLLHKRREQLPHRRVALGQSLRVPLDPEEKVPAGRLHPL